MRIPILNSIMEYNPDSIIPILKNETYADFLVVIIFIMIFSIPLVLTAIYLTIKGMRNNKKRFDNLVTKLPPCQSMMVGE